MEAKRFACMRSCLITDIALFHLVKVADFYLGEQKYHLETVVERAEWNNKKGRGGGGG